MRTLPVAVVLIALAACQPADPGRDPRFELGDFCYDHDDCNSGICLFEEVDATACTIPCAIDADCGDGWVCGVRDGGERVCLFPCEPPGNLICADGVPNTCAALDDETFCELCGCTNDPERPRCDPGVGCTTRSDLGGPCLDDDDCRTGNCSRYDRVCRVPLGQPCTGVDDCDSCMIDAETGWSFCSRTCHAEDPCQAGGGECLGPVDGGRFTCLPGCVGCPGRCATSVDRGDYCDCTDCTIAEARAVGYRCFSDDECASGMCWRHDGAYGTCTAVCSSDADCGRLARCVDVPCGEGSTSDCGPMCAALCDRFGLCEDYRACTEMVSVAGGTTSVCDMRLGDGANCSSDAQCHSQRCDASRCTAASGIANGSACDTDANCESTNCVSGICRGTQLLGDSCVNTTDCLVGTCCTSGATAGTCQNSC